MWPAGCSKAWRQTDTVKGFAVSSTAPNVGISPAVAPSQRPLTPSLPQDNGAANDTSPFAALLDAAATTPPTAGSQPTGTLTTSLRASTAGDQDGPKPTSAPTGQSAGPTATAPADPVKDAAASAAPGASTNPPANALQPQNPTGQAGAPSPSDLIGNDPQFAAFLGALMAPANNNVPVDSSTPGSTAKTASDSADGSQDDGSDGTATGAATPAGQPQPLAAAFVASVIVATPPAGDATTSDVTIGGSVGAKPLLPSIGTADLAADQGTQSASVASGNALTTGTQAPMDGNAAAAQAASDASVTQNAGNTSVTQSVKAPALTQDANIPPPISPDGRIAAPIAPNSKATASSQNTKTTGPQPSTVASNGAAPANTDNAAAGSPADPTNAPAWNSAVPQPQLQADGDDAAPAQSGGAGHADGFASGDAGAANTQGASTAAKPTDGVANFGFAAIAQATPTAAAAPATAAAAAVNAAVPIAGLPVAIAARAFDGATQFDIRLDPPELGRIAVRLDVDRDGQVTSHVTVDRADTLQLLQSQQPQLERALEQAGLKTADNGLQFTLRDQSFAGQNGQNGQGGSQANTATVVIPDADQPAIATTQIYSRFTRVSGIDIRV